MGKGIYYVGGKPYISGRPATSLDMGLADNANQVAAKEQAARVAQEQQAALQANIAREAAARDAVTADAARKAQAMQQGANSNAGLQEAMRLKSVGTNPGAAVMQGLGELFK